MYKGCVISVKANPGNRVSGKSVDLQRSAKMLLLLQKRIGCPCGVVTLEQRHRTLLQGMENLTLRLLL